MRTLTLGSCRPTIAEAIGVCADSDRVPLRLNMAEERLLNRPAKWVGSFVRYRVCVGENGCFAWPRCISTIEAFAICNSPGTIRDQTYEFQGPPVGNGLLGENSWPGTQLIDRGMACSYDNVTATAAAPRKIQIIATNAADAGKTVTLRYFDSNGNKVYTSIGSVVQEGELLTIPAPPAYVLTSSNVMNEGLYHVQKDVTDYPVLMYEVDATPVATKLLAKYEPSETLPIYRRSFVPGFNSMPACCGTTADCTLNKAITALVKLQHVDVVNDRDPLALGNLSALTFMCMAIERELANRFDEADALESRAYRELEGELGSFLGDGVVMSMRVQGNGLFGSGQDYGWACTPGCCR